MLRIFIDNVLLSQEQLDVLAPLLNVPLGNSADFENRCKNELLLAGCPLVKPKEGGD